MYMFVGDIPDVHIRPWTFQTDIPAQLLSVRANASRPSGFFSSLSNSAGAGLGSTVGGLAGALL